jgi:lipopolysaccharide export LptBFGC system permease protein LptF
VNVLLKLLYAAAITALFVLFVAFGVRTFYGPPEMLEFPQPPPGILRPVAPAPPGVSPEELTPEQLEYTEEQERYQEAYEAFQDDLKQYHAIVFAVAALIGVAAVAGGVALSARLDALRLGLVGGGLGTLIYGVVQAEGDIDEIGAAPVFVIVALGLLLVAGAGYRWLAAQES